MFVAMELPFRCIKHETFHEFLSIVAPSLNVISYTTLARDIYKLWDNEKEKLKEFISQNCQRVCLTIDTWTSSQNLSYICLISHFIDNNWKLQKKVLNFCQVISRTGKTMAKKVEHCLSKWVMVITIFFQQTSSNKFELSKYLEEALWKLNSGRFPILAKMTRDLLTIPISTVASEFAFSTEGRVLDPYHSSLTPRMVEALICTQDWLKRK
uniref:AC transposase n=1 Tax=Cajanus cajan TaxID=3821 RepID=A0A151U492_CAJCA|nr:Putative AC transposase [Cajanus cajan]